MQVALQDLSCCSHERSALDARVVADAFDPDVDLDVALRVQDGDAAIAGSGLLATRDGAWQREGCRDADRAGDGVRRRATGAC